MMKNLLIIILTLTTVGFVHDLNGQVTLYGVMSELETGSRKGNVKISVMQGTNVIGTTTSGSNGRYSVQFPVGGKYKIVYESAGYVSKFLEVDVSKINEEDIPAGGKIFPSIDLDLFKVRPGVDFSFLDNEPVVKWFYDNDHMNFDGAHVNRVKKKIQDKLDEAGSDNSEAEYNALIQEADQLFNNGKYNEAMEKYIAAIKIPGKEAESHPNNRIVEIGDILQKKAEEELTFQQDNQEYINLIKEADDLASVKKYQQAIDKYEEASNLNPNEQYPKDRISELELTVANAAKQGEYDELIKLADMFLKQNSLEAARDNYQKASRIFPNEQYPKDKLAELNSKIEEQSAARELKQKYNDAIREADAHYDKGEWESAIAKYTEALAIEDASPYPSERIAMANAKWDEEKAEQEKRDNFERLVTEADAHVENTEYEPAIAKYTEALALISDEAVEGKKKNAEQLLVAQIENAEKLEQFEELVAQGDEAVEQKAYENAINKYTEALALFDNPDVQSKKVNAEQLLAFEQENAEKLDQFNQLVAQGDQEVEQKNYESAIQLYQEALALIQNEDIQAKITATQEQLALQQAEQNKLDSFNQLVENGNNQFDNENYEIAIDRYTEALALIDDQAVKDKKALAEQQLAQQREGAALEEQFDRLVEEGDIRMNQSDFQEAISKYQEALSLKDDSDVKDKKTNAEKLLEKQLAEGQLKQQVDSLFTVADNKIATEEYTGAIADYDAIIALIGDKAVGISGVNEEYQRANQGKERAQQLLTEKESQSELEEQFNILVSEADKSFSQENWEDAKLKYTAAKAIISNSEHVNNRIDEITTIQNEIHRRENIASEIQTLLDQAANLKMDDKWNLVIQKYEEALGLDNSRTDIESLLVDARNQKQAFDSQQSQEQLFQQLKDEGMQFMALQQWGNAKGKFEEALTIQDDSEIRTQLQIIAEKLVEEQAENELNAAYQAKMDEGENLITNKRYEQAILKFEEALEIKENDPIAQSKINDVRQLIQQQENAEEASERYDEAMEKGREALANKDFSLAVDFFEAALLEKPLDSEATTLRDQAKAEIDALRSEEESYNRFVSEGQSLFDQALINDNDIPTLEQAKEKYRSAQEIRPNASIPQVKIVEIDNLIRQIQDNMEEIADQNEARYQEQIQFANIEAQAKNYEKAIQFLQKASEIKPNESYPPQKIHEYQNIIQNLNLEAQNENQYNQAISAADIAYDNKKFQQSIDLYNQALTFKPNESYPTTQIEKAKSALKDLEENAERLQFESLVNNANNHFSNNEYQEALNKYQEAKNIIDDDSFVNDRIDEVQQILKNFDEQRALNAQKEEQYKQYILKADQYFDAEEYLEAKKQYDLAISVKANDVYAIERSKLSVIKSKEKTDMADELLYQKILSKADTSLDEENYEKAIELYERAISLRSNDPYPHDKIEEIQRLLSTAKENRNIEYLGQKEDISILEGAALLEEGARMREQLKRESVETELRRNEGVAEDKSAKDLEERHAYENEVVAIKDRRNQIKIEEFNQHRILVEDVETQQQTYEKLQNRLDGFEEGQRMYNYKSIDFIEEDLEKHKSGLEDDHRLMVERIKVIESERDSQLRNEMIEHSSNVVANSEEIIKTEKLNEERYELNRLKNIDLEVKVDDIIKGQEMRVFDDNNANYQRVLDLENKALIAEIKTTQSMQDKSEVTNQLRDDIYALDAIIQRQNNQEVEETYATNKQIDQLLTRAEDIYVETQEGKKDEKLKIVEQVKEIEHNDLLQMNKRNEKYYAETQYSNDIIESVDNLQDAEKRAHKEDLSQLNEAIKNQVEVFERNELLRNDIEQSERNLATRTLDKIESDDMKIKAEKAKVKEENHEALKGLEASISDDGQTRGEELRRNHVNTQELLDKLENNSLTFSPKLANTIGDEYPEGVSQENYVRKDARGIPVKIVTRRFVVKDGYGEIFMRIQTRNGLTYSRNGTPITEQVWINGTENANLKKNY